MDDNKLAGSFGRISTLTALMAGLAVIAMCVIVPQADANRRMAYEHDRLMADLDQINHQKSVNEEFIAKLDSDPQLAQRLAQRQMRMMPQGESLLAYKTSGPTTGAGVVSPFTLVHVPAPEALPPYQAAGGVLGEWLLDSHVRLYCLGAGLYVVAMGLVLGSNGPHEQCASHEQCPPHEQCAST
jgi:hypothetical protein